MSELTSKQAGRLFVAVMGLFFGAVFLAALAAPLVFNLLIGMGRSFQSLEKWRDIEFVNVASRCVLVFLVAGLYPALRWGGLRSLADVGWANGRGQTLIRAFGVGCGTMLLIYIGGWAVGAFVFKTPDWSEVAGKAMAYLIGAWLVGIIEETVFRGALFGSMNRLIGFVGAALFSSIFFSAVHFIEPDPAIGTVYGHWYSGFKLFAGAFRAVSGGPAFPFCITLFLMGFVLCACCRYYGSIQYAVGLHAGWVWPMRISDYFLEAGNRRGEIWFGPDAAVPRSWLAVCFMTVFLVVYLFRLRGVGVQK